MSDTDPNNKPDELPMSEKKYEQQPESNVGGTVDRDVDPPNPKVQEETPEEAQRREDGEMLLSDQEAQKQRDKYGDEMREHADKATEKQHKKLDSNTKPGVDE